MCSWRRILKSTVGSQNFQTLGEFKGTLGALLGVIQEIWRGRGGTVPLCPPVPPPLHVKAKLKLCVVLWYSLVARGGIRCRRLAASIGYPGQPLLTWQSPRLATSPLAYIGQGHNIWEVTEHLFVARSLLSSLWLQATAVEKWQRHVFKVSKFLLVNIITWTI